MTRNFRSISHGAITYRSEGDKSIALRLAGVAPDFTGVQRESLATLAEAQGALVLACQSVRWGLICSRRMLRRCLGALYLGSEGSFERSVLVLDAYLV